MPRIVTAQEAAALIQDGDFVIVGGNGGTGTPEAVIEAVEARFLDGSGPHGLTLFHVTGIGAITEHGLCHFSHPGLVRRVIGGHYGLQVPFMALIDGNAIEAYNFPQGVMSGLCRAMAAGQPGVLTHVGLQTYMEPALGGGRMNARTTEELVESVHLAGRDWLFYRAPGRPTVALIRGTSADEDGYVSMEHEATTREDLSIAQAVHNAGGTVICQVKRMVRRGTINPQMVKLPGFLVDCLVVEPGQMQTFATVYDPSRSGETQVPMSSIVPDPLSDRRVMARRAAFELLPGDVVNLGVGVSAMIPNVAAEEGIADLITLTVEAGVIGGVPGHGREFGTAINPRAIIDQGYQFDFYDGGGLSCAFLSFAEVDAAGNVNVTRFGNRFAGAGGFIDITQNTQRLVFSGSLTGAGLRVDLTGDGISIRQEGQLRKFVPEVEQISFSGKRAQETGQHVTFVTERAVFELLPEGVTLTEIAPGIRLQEDVVDQMGFRPRISPALRPMDARLFRPGPMGLRDGFLAQAAPAAAQVMSLFLEDVMVGAEWCTDSHLVTAADIAAFGVLTRDQHKLHTDAEYCRSRGFPGIIAHGLYGLALMEGLKTELRLYETTSIASLGWDKVRFRHPILAGDRLHLRFRFLSVRDSRQPDRGVVTEALELVNGDGTVVIDGEHAGLLLRRTPVA